MQIAVTYQKRKISGMIVSEHTCDKMWLENVNICDKDLANSEDGLCDPFDDPKTRHHLFLK